MIFCWRILLDKLMQIFIMLWHLVAEYRVSNLMITVWSAQERVTYNFLWVVYVTSIDSGHYTASINCCKKTFYCNDHKITEFGTTDKNSFTAYIVLYKWIDTWFLDSNRRVGVWSLPRRWHILSIPLTTGRGTSAETCGLDDVFPPDDLGSRPEALC